MRSLTAEVGLRCGKDGAPWTPSVVQMGKAWGRHGEYVGFHKWGIPKMVFIEWNILLKWCFFRGTPISGNTHMESYSSKQIPKVLEGLVTGVII